MKIKHSLRIRSVARPRHLFWLAFLLLIPVLAVLMALRPGERAMASTTGRIVFASERTGDWEIFAMNPDGSNVVNLTRSSSTKDERPGNSPNGQKIAFARQVGANTDIYTMNADGSGLTRLTTHPAMDHGPQWSPDGQKIAFRSDRDGNAEIYVMNADGSNQTRLTTGGAKDHGPDWSPNGDQIIFSSDRGGNDNVYVMNANGTGVTQLTNNTAADFGASWSPDGSRVVFRSDRAGNPEVFIMNIDGSGQTNLTQSAGEDRGPAWSPDGSKVVFYSNRTGDYEIYMMNPDGSNVTRITYTTGRDFQPDWTGSGGVVEPGCYTLTRSHSGQGNDPVASPARSAACSTGKYVAGELISLTAAPASGWKVNGWGGTANNSSTSLTNSLTMPANNHTVSVTYGQTGSTTCYQLTRKHVGRGNNPVPSPAYSPGCPKGQFVAGQQITLTARPRSGWRVASWTGTSNDASTLRTNLVIMPAAPHIISVKYVRK